MFLRRSWAGSQLLLPFLCSTSSLAKVVPLIQPGFFFDHNIPGQSPPIPITSQCEKIHIVWSRSAAIGNFPVPPYTLQVLTDQSSTPFIIPAGSGLNFDWDVPFAPGTQYQICMYDKNGVPGGCHSTHTVIQNTTVANPTCQNVTAPPQLDAEPKVAGGPMPPFVVVDQCTDISITPKGGKPPYTLTVSPPLHPTYNITSQNMDPIVWTVSLPWAFPFFMSLVSSDGLMWATGPLHSGGFGPDDCLVPGSIPRKKAAGIAAGASFATLFGGLLLGYAGLVLFRFIQRRRKSHPGLTPWEGFDRQVPQLPGRFLRLRDENERNPDVREKHHPPSRSPPQYNTPSGERVTQPSTGAPVPTRTVIFHYDGGRLRTEQRESEDVIELPPEYRRPSSDGGRVVSSKQEATMLISSIA